ncbi:hypothetical protein AB6F62_10060 [Providencia huaxiensis]
MTAGRKAGLMTCQHLQQLALLPSNDRARLTLTYHTVFGAIYRD